MRQTSAELAALGAATTHLITPFDSGGSSATLRRFFNIPAIGDLRAQIMALADKNDPANSGLYTLFSYRLPKENTPKRLRAELEQLAHGRHPLIRQIREPLRGILKNHLYWLKRRMPLEFPLGGASVGNLVIAAACLRKKRLTPAGAMLSRLVRARGLVCPIVDACAHLAARLESGRVVLGQHMLTGKECPPIDSPIAEIWLVASLDDPSPASLALTERTAGLIRNGGLICYPPGSFYSSIVANLLPAGVGRAVAANPNLKIFIPNLGHDPELLGHSVQMQVERLLAPLEADAPLAKTSNLLSAILVDSRNGVYPGGIPHAALERMGVRIIDLPLVSIASAPLADARLLAAALFELAKPGGR